MEKKINDKIDEMMKDLNLLDSSMHENRGEMMKMIRELMESRPDTGFSSAFEKRLGKDLRERIALMESSRKEEGGRRPFFAGRKQLMGIAAAVIAAAAVIPLGINFWKGQSGRDRYVYEIADDEKPQEYRISPDKKEKKIGEGIFYGRSGETGNRQEASKPHAVRDGYSAAQRKGVVPGSPYVSRSVPSAERRSMAMEGEPVKMKDKASVKKESMKQPDSDDVLMSEKQDGKDSREREFNTDQYSLIYENDFLKSADNPLSTFSIDVDTASYANVRRFLAGRRLPPRDSVRIEEMINYFTYDYPVPDKGSPFSITTEIGAAPWNKKNLLVHIGLKGREIPEQELPPSNLVFLIDVSGSMSAENKLGLIKKSFALLVRELPPASRVAIVVYAGATGLVLPSTPGEEKGKILAAIDKLEAGGPTAGSAGISLAYKVASDNFIKGGNNRIIIATDGDFNIGQSSNAELTRLIESRRDKGIFLTVLGFGMGNYKDSMLESLADKGNGNYAYIDSLQEAKKVMSTDLKATLFTIAKDVKLQVEFNPAVVESYRLIGYENRMLKKEDFNDDKKDAGELGSGHSVTALYEIVPVRERKDGAGGEALRYQESKIKSGAYASGEIMTLKLRYKEPDGNTSKLIEKSVPYVIEKKPSDNFVFSSAVAEWGLILRGSKYKGDASYGQVLELARKSLGKDRYGYREEFLRLVKASRGLDKDNQ